MTCHDIGPLNDQEGHVCDDRDGDGHLHLKFAH